MLIINAHVLPIGCDEILSAFILVEKGRIIRVDDMKYLSAEDLHNYSDDTLDVKGCMATPGLIDSHCHLGLFRDLVGDREINVSSSTEKLDFYAADAIDFFDAGFKKAMECGVTAAVVSPGSARPAGGFSCAVKTYSPENFVTDNYDGGVFIKRASGFKLALGDNVYSHSGMNKMEVLSYIRGFLSDNIHKKCRLFSNTDESAAFSVHAHSAGDILTAIALADEYGFDLTLIHATQAALVTDYILKSKAKVILGPAVCSITKPELAGFDLSTAKMLHERGIKFSISTDSPEVPSYLLTTCAGLYVKFGLDEMEALRCITNYAAEICGLYERIGSLSPGKDADIVVWSEFPLNTKAVPEYVIAGGKLI